MSETRRNTFVAWMLAGDVHLLTCEGGEHEVPIHRAQRSLGMLPVVVTPLLPDDPRPGETWISPEGLCEVTGPVYFDGELRAHYVPTTKGDWFPSDLHRKPALKAFHANVRQYQGSDEEFRSIWIDIRAKSKEAAMAQIAEALKEVEP